MTTMCTVFAWLVLFVSTAVLGQYVEVSCPAGCSCFDHRKADCVCNDKLKNIPQTLSPQLESLSVSDCPLTTLKPEQFARYRLLQKLVLQKHKLELIQPFTFRGLNNLEELVIRWNMNLKKLTNCALGGVHANGAFTIYLNENNITDIEGFVFADTRRLRTLHLDGNPVRRVHKHAFSGLYTMNTLNLPPNLHLIQPLAFNNFTRLHHLLITKWHAGANGGVQSLTFKNETIQGLRHVSSVAIRHSDLGEIHAHAFSGVHVIERIEVVDCVISRLRRRALVGARNVGGITFRHNQIHRIDRNFFNFVDDGTAVFFEHNHFNCTCRNLWLLLPKSRDRLPAGFTGNNYCAWPPELRDRSFDMIPDSWVDKCTAQLLDAAQSAAVHVISRLMLVIILLLPYTFQYFIHHC